MKKRIFSMELLILVLLISAVASTSVILWTIPFCLQILLLADLGMSRYVGKKLEIEFMTNSFTIRNRSSLPILTGQFLLSCHNNLTDENQFRQIEFYLGGNEEITSLFSTEELGIGGWILTVCELQLGLMKHSCDGFLSYAGYVPVLPGYQASYNLDRVETLLTQGDGDEVKAGFDPEETVGIRNYMPGDPVRFIHWKLSAKKDELMLRETGEQLNQNPLFFVVTTLSNHLLHMKKEEADHYAFMQVNRMQALYDLCIESIETGCSVKIAWYDFKKGIQYHEIGSVRALNYMMTELFHVTYAASDPEESDPLNKLSILEGFGTNQFILWDFTEFEKCNNMGGIQDYE